jgi:hypothetical protein
MTPSCFYCHRPIDPAAPNIWRRVIAWERKAMAGSRKRGSDIALRTPVDEYAHGTCIGLAKDGITPGQQTLT